MAALSPAAQDRLLLLGLGITACAALGLMRHLLTSYRVAAIIPPSEIKPQYITQDVEDSLKISTLNKLLDNPNYSIQETTATIICERALHDETTTDTLFYYITRPDHAMREKGIRALTMMMNSREWSTLIYLDHQLMPILATVGVINKPKIYAAIMKSLEYSLTDYKHNEYDPEWDNWNLRDVAEQGCLLVLGQMADKFGVSGLVKARFVERWLAKEPWGGDDDDERQLNFMSSLTKPYRLNQICLPLFRDAAGRKQLEDARLLPHKIVYDESETTVLDIRMINGEGTAGEDFGNFLVESMRPRRGQSSEDEDLRRRHREAMVLNDGSRPLARGDIIERER
jgi:hypothetical protein